MFIGFINTPGNSIIRWFPWPRKAFPVAQAQTTQMDLRWKGIPHGIEVEIIIVVFHFNITSFAAVFTFFRKSPAAQKEGKRRGKTNKIQILG